MFSLLYGLWTLIMSKKELKFLIVGIDNAGKTTTLECIKKLYESKTPKIPLDRVKPTIGLNLCYVNFDYTFSGIFWDFGGQLMLRSIWENHYKECDGLVYVVDSTDVQRFKEVATTLQSLVNHSALQGRSLPIVLLANKQDIKNICIPLHQLIRMLGLEQAVQCAKILNYPQSCIQSNPLAIGSSLPKEAPNQYHDRTQNSAIFNTLDVTKKRNVSSSSILSGTKPNSFSNISQTNEVSLEPLHILETYARIICVAGCCATKNINVKPALSLLIEEVKTKQFGLTTS